MSELQNQLAKLIDTEEPARTGAKLLAAKLLAMSAGLGPDKATALLVRLSDLEHVPHFHARRLPKLGNVVRWTTQQGDQTGEVFFVDHFRLLVMARRGDGIEETLSFGAIEPLPTAAVEVRS